MRILGGGSYVSTCPLKISPSPKQGRNLIVQISQSKPKSDRSSGQYLCNWGLSGNGDMLPSLLYSLILFNKDKAVPSTAQRWRSRRSVIELSACFLLLRRQLTCAKPRRRGVICNDLEFKTNNLKMEETLVLLSKTS